MKHYINNNDYYLFFCMMTMPPESALFNEHIHGLYREHQSWLYGWLCRKMQNQHDAADLTQDAFVKIMLHYSDYYYQEPRALLTTVAKSLMSNHYRRKKIEQAYLNTLLPEQEGVTISLEQQILLIETLSELCEIIDAMPLRQKQVFILSQLHGLSYGNIAKQLGISIATIKRDLTKAMMLCFMAME